MAEEKCTCSDCPNCGHLEKEKQGCLVCEGQRSGPGRADDIRCPTHGIPDLPPSEEK